MVEKLKKKNVEVNDTVPKSIENDDRNISYLEVSEANAELVRSGAKLSLEDMESDSFSIIAEVFDETNQNPEQALDSYSTKEVSNKNAADNKIYEIFPSSIEDFMDSVPINDKNIPSPSEILKNLCLTNDDIYIGTH